MARIAVAGFQHETNTFGPSLASFEDFERGAGWPALCRGRSLIASVAGVNIAIAGALEEGRRLGHEIVPLAYAQASPSAHVTDDAFERITAIILDELEAALPIDALYLDLHGAMVTQAHEDGEGELLARLRRRLGSRLPIVASLDFHANISDSMVALSTAIVVYRTYPHVDMAESGERAMALLHRILASGQGPARAFRRLSFLIPLPWQCTTIAPAAELFAELGRLETAVESLSFAPGFPLADIADCGPSVLAYGADVRQAERVADRMARLVEEAEPDFAGRIFAPVESVREAMRLGLSDGRPVVIADTQDNPGAGANSDTVGMLRALLEARAEGAAFGLVCDPEVARAAHQAGEGAEIHVALGGKSGLPDQRPFEGTFKVLRLGDGRVVGTGPFYGGSRMRLGPMAKLGIGGVEVLVASRKAQAADQAMFRHLDIEPASRRVLVLKSSVHFRADFQPIAQAVLVAASPGPNPIDLVGLPFRHLRAGMRLMPLGPAFSAARA